jgi:ABC-2 type transport system ATP-binding protein
MMIKVENVTKSFGNLQALRQISLHVKKGSIYGLIGVNGAGKTTLINHLTGTFKPDAGDIKICGETVYENVRCKQKIGYIPDELYFFPQYTVQQMANFYRQLYPNWNGKRYIELQKVFELDEKRRIGKMSKGMQRQVAFWLTLCTMPEVLILDEPIDGLDPFMRKKVWKLLIEDVAEREMSVLISSHNLKEIENVCDHVGIIDAGRMILEQDLDELKSDFYKVQIAYRDGFPEKAGEQMTILHREDRGSVSLLIIKGDKEKNIEQLQQHKPLLLDMLPLTLEEIFIYELGGKGYNVEDIIH